MGLSNLGENRAFKLQPQITIMLKYRALFVENVSLLYFKKYSWKKPKPDGKYNTDN